MTQHPSAPRRFVLALLGLSLLLGSCADNPFKVMFGDKVLFTPRESTGPLADPALQACLNQVLSQTEGSSIATLRTLACPGAGVQSLEGIGALAQLEQLELSSNRITDISPLRPLRNLRVLNLSDNRVGNVGILDSLPILRFVSLQGNNTIACRQLNALQNRLGNTLTRPTQCL
jgi:Leucine-rich repeat (LRR) protein